MKLTEFQVNECIRCGKKWASNKRTLGKRPKACPQCKNMNWDGKLVTTWAGRKADRSVKSKEVK